MSAQSLIEVYRTGFYISMVIAVIGLLLSVLLFFRFRVKNIWEIRSGRAQKTAVREMQEAGRSKSRMRKEEESREAVRADIAGAGEETTEKLYSPSFEITQHIILIHTSEILP